MNFPYIRTPNSPGSPVQVSGEGRRSRLETGVTRNVSAEKLAFAVYRKLTLRCVLCVLHCFVEFKKFKSVRAASACGVMF